MSYTKAIEAIEEAEIEIQDWLKHGKFLLSGENIDQVQEPIATTECSLGFWIDSEKETLKDKAWFDKVVQAHERSHEAYSKLYHETHRIYNPKTYGELQEYFTALEVHSEELMQQLEKTKEHLEEMPEIHEAIVEELKADLEAPSTIEIHTSEKPENSLNDSHSHPAIKPQIEPTIEIETKVEISNHSTDTFQQQLITQDSKQIELKKQLLQLEINQLKERQKLTQQSAEQLKQFQQLKQKEQEQIKLNINNLEPLKQEELESKKQELFKLTAEHLHIEQELKKMAHVSSKLDQKKTEGKFQDEEQLQQLKQLEQQKQQLTDESENIHKLKALRIKDLEQLEEQVILAKQDIEEFEKQQQTKNEEQTQLQDQLMKNQQGLEEDKQRLEQLSKKKQEVEEIKQNTLKTLEEKKQSVNKELKIFEQNITTMKEQKKNDLLTIEDSIDQLEKEHRKNIENLNKLEQEQQQKQLDLTQLEQSSTTSDPKISKMPEDSIISEEVSLPV